MKKHPTEKELRRSFEKESRAIFTQMIEELPRGYLWEAKAIQILKGWRAQKIALGVDSNLPDYYKIDPPVFVDGWVENGEQVHRGASNFSIFATFYDDEEAKKALAIVLRVLRSGASSHTGYAETGRRGGLDCRAFCRGTFWTFELARDLEAREKDLNTKKFNP